MKKNTFIISTLILGCSSLMTPAIHAGDLGCDKREYSCYQTWVDNFCKASDKPWNKEIKDVGSVENRYAELSAKAQNKKIAEIVNKEKYPTERAKLEAELDLSRIGAFEGFKAAEIARIEYRNNMNKIFSCAVIATRIEKTKKVQALIQKTGSSEITEKLKADIKKLEQLKPTSCATNMGTDALNDYSMALASSATAEYCSYRNYLDYIQANIDSNYTNIMQDEQKIGQADGNTGTTSTTESTLQSITSRADQIQSDIARAESTLPKALVAYREMVRTYDIHLMLVIIYDDYIELRQNLNIYLSAVSQLFEKAKNAQSSNNY